VIFSENQAKVGSGDTKIRNSIYKLYNAGISMRKSPGVNGISFIVFRRNEFID